MSKAFRIFDHTADIGITVFGADIEQIFSNAAMALFALMTDTQMVEEKLQRELRINGQDIEGLLVDWLNELIYLFDTEQILFRRFQIESLTDKQLKARCYGERFHPSRHKIVRGIKAATYHMLKLDKHEGGYTAQVIFDI
jgi:SHS2 domain-containing protein